MNSLKSLTKQKSLGASIKGASGVLMKILRATEMLTLRLLLFHTAFWMPA
jgi:hypothetical protein